MIASLSRTMAVQLPLIPSFLRSIRKDASVIAIEELTDDELRELGRQWTNALVAHAIMRRKGVSA